MHLVITSFSDQGFEEYGEEFLRTYLAHWKTPLRIYYEGGMVPAYLQGVSNSSQVELVPLSSVADWVEFESKLSFPIMRGRIDEEAYTVNFDATHVRKTMMHVHAFKPGRKHFWLDADSITHTDVPPAFLDEVLPDNKLGVFLGREGCNIPYTESGFLGFNGLHPQCNEMLQLMRHVALQGLNFTMPFWHDCAIFDTCRKHYPREFFNDIGWGTGIRHSHVFVNSVLGKYMDHKKGNRKALGHSLASDLEKPRDEAYWAETHR